MPEPTNIIGGIQNAPDETIRAGEKPAPAPPSPPDVALLPDAEVPKWLSERERRYWMIYSDAEGHEKTHLRTIASLRAALARAAEENAEWRARDTADIDAAADADKARREARELRERAESCERVLRLVVADVECYCTDEYPRPCASCEARGLLGGEGA